ncbi:molybdopterin oxidoreductase family protein [Aeromicrobium sp. UC242_57]|uniref:molybdopterin oxidoreductase family protein n=1 Tax=Aeromicrobium sp. UC242_57 TaxID=3374624 RepID=UPI0037B11FBB
MADRITTPLRRGTSGFEEVSWDEALDDIAARVTALSAEHGPDTIAVFGGGGLTNEKAYQLGKFARLALRTRNIDYNGRFCMSSAAAASNRSLGVDRGLPFPLTDLADGDVVMLFGSNLADTMPPAVQHLGSVRDRGGLLVVDPRRSATARLTDDGAGEHLPLVPGTDLVLALGLLHIVLARGAGRRRLSCGPGRRSRRGSTQRGAVVARTGRRHDRRARDPAAPDRAHPGRRQPTSRWSRRLPAHGSRIRAACRRHRHRHRGDQSGSRAGTRRGRARRLRRDHRSGQRSGRTRARSKRPISCRATG